MFLDVLLDLTLSHRQIQTGQRMHVWVRAYTSWSALNLSKLALILELLRRILECGKTRENYGKLEILATRRIL